MGDVLGRPVVRAAVGASRLKGIGVALEVEWLTYAGGEQWFALRWHTTEASLLARGRYVASGLARLRGREAALLAVAGEFTRQDRLDVERWLRENGVTRVVCERHGMTVEYDLSAGSRARRRIARATTEQEVDHAVAC